jgi:hypothetical protein
VFRVSGFEFRVPGLGVDFAYHLAPGSKAKKKKKGMFPLLSRAQSPILPGQHLFVLGYTTSGAVQALFAHALADRSVQPLHAHAFDVVPYT